jgi:hypothetical protein
LPMSTPNWSSWSCIGFARSIDIFSSHPLLQPKNMKWSELQDTFQNNTSPSRLSQVRKGWRNAVVVGNKSTRDCLVLAQERERLLKLG